MFMACCARTEGYYPISIQRERHVSIKMHCLPWVTTLIFSRILLNPQGVKSTNTALSMVTGKQVMTLSNYDITVNTWNINNMEELVILS